MRKYYYVRRIDDPTYDLLGPIIQQAFGTAFTREAFEIMSTKNAIWLGAYDAHLLIGCVAVTFASPKRARLHKLAVLPDRRSTGLGRFLVQHAEREAFMQGAKKMELVCVTSENGLATFYGALQYKIIKHKPYKQSPWRLAFMEKSMPHLIDQVGEKVHAYLLPVQTLEITPKPPVEVVLVYHPDEIDKPSNTGHVIQRSIPALTKELIWHRHTIDEQVTALSSDYETLLLYPSEQAIPLDQYCAGLDKVQKPLRLIVIDATWQQAQKMMLQSPSLKTLSNVKLVNIPKSQYVLRKHQKPMGLCTLESVAEAFTELGYPEVKSQLMATFFEWMRVGYQRYK